MVSNGIDPNLAQHFVGPDLGPYYLQRQKSPILETEKHLKSETDSIFLFIKVSHKLLYMLGCDM